MSKNLRKYKKVWHELRNWAKRRENMRKCDMSWEIGIKEEKIWEVC